MPSRRLFLTSAAVVASGVIGFFAGRQGHAPTPAPQTPSIAGPSSGDRPLIGIASLNDSNYSRAVRDHGGIPVVLPNTDGSVARIDDYLEKLDGLLMPGGLDIPPSEKGGNHRDTLHPVTIEPDSRLSRIFQSPGFEVNSHHHQAVDTLSQGLRIVATSPDGIVEATESTDASRFLVGVQWHPERLIESDPAQARLFEAFIEAASNHAVSQ